MKYATCLLAALAPIVAHAVSGVDVSQPVSLDAAKCMAGSRSFAIVRAWCSFGGPDTNAPATVANFWNAGFAHVDVYAFPCRSQDATTQANNVVDYLHSHGVKYGQIWLDVETNPSPGCGWALAEDRNTGMVNVTAGEDNCAYIGEWMSALKARGVNPGVYVSSYMWGSIAGSACTSASGQALWYPHYDGSPSFSDFVPFGGWRSPAMKQYSGTGSICGIGVDENWYP